MKALSSEFLNAVIRKYKLLIAVVILLVIVRLILPYVVLHYVNLTLAGMRGYYGHATDIDLSLYRGAYVINDIRIDRIDPAASNRRVEFFSSRKVDLSVEWKSLFRGSLVGKLAFFEPELYFTKDKAEITDVGRDTPDFRKLLKHFMPLRVNRLEIKDGGIHYVDNTSKPKVDISLKKTHILALNLTSILDKKIELPSTVTAEASVYGGFMTFAMKLDPLADKATFDLNTEIEGINLALLNDFLRAYGKFDVVRGRLGLYAEIAARNGRFIGYIKPEINELRVVGPKDRKDSFFNKLWEYIVGAGGVVFKNQSKDQLATKIRMEGDIKDPQISIVNIVWEILRNAFIQALLPRIDNEININSVKPEKNRS